MSDRSTEAAALWGRTQDLLLATYADFYRQEIGAEEDVHRTLPFFGTALGLVIGAIAYGAGRLPPWQQAASKWPFLLPAGLLVLSLCEAGAVLFWLGRAIARRNYRRIGPESAFRERLTQLHAYYEARGLDHAEIDTRTSEDLRQLLLESYEMVTPANRLLNQRRYMFRALASSHLVRSLLWALGATTLIFVSDKLGLLVKVG